MKCPKCNYTLPDDSEFCQYCGNRIEKETVPPVVEAPTISVKNTTTATPVEEIPQQPPLKTPQPVVQTIPAPMPKKKKTENKKYCSRCGSPIDNKTKKCTGCGKQYFRALRFTKILVTVLIIVLMIAAVSGLCLLQYKNTQESINNLESKVIDLKQQVKDKEAYIASLKKEVEELEGEQWSNSQKLNFFDNYVEIIPDDGANTYHKWGCSKLDTKNGFWIFNTSEAAKNYEECPYCH